MVALSRRPVRETRDVAGLAARRVAVKAVDALLRRRVPVDETIDADPGFHRLEPRDRAFVKALTLTTCRRLGQISETLDAKLDKGLPTRAGAIEAILATAAAQILFLDVPDHAAVDLAVRLVREDRDAERYAGLTNAVLRATARAGAPAAGPAANLPAWLGERWSNTYGDAVTLAIAEAHLAPPPLDLSVKGDARAWAERLGATVLPTGTLRIAEPSGPVTTLPGFDEGAWWVQDAGARLPVLVAGASKGARVADLCAAPGGKTAALAATGAKVTAVDHSVERMAMLMRNMERLGLPVEPIVRDVREAQLASDFDVVLLDAPCTATGTIRRHPDVAWAKREGDVASLARLQAELLDAAAGAVRPGGRLVYATCSLEPEEGERHVEAFLGRQRSFALAPVAASEIGGLAECVTADGVVRARPDMLAAHGGIDGFFVARFTRAG
jgi:16S rRNA (cytosine967-C5)-methyltransferase